MPEVLADQEGIRALLDHEHRGGVLQDVRVLQGLAEASLLGDRPEQLVDGHTVELGGLLGVEHEVVGIGLTNSQPCLERSLLIEQGVALDFQQGSESKRANPSSGRCESARSGS